MQSRIVPLIIVGVIVLVLSLWLGQGIATNQMQTLLIAGAGVGLMLCILLGQRIWILMMMLLAMEVPVIRGFHASELGQAMFIGFSILIFMMHKLKLDWRFTEMDFWRIVLVICIIQVYLRNPVGLNVLGAGSVGARPYFLAALAFMTAFILSKYRIQPREINWAMWAAIVGAVITLPINSWRYGLGRGPAIETVGVTSGYEGEGAGRIGKYNTWAKSFSVIIGSRVNPLKASFHPGWAFLILFTLALAALSGYRNTVAYVGLVYLVAIAYRGGVASMIGSAVIGAVALGFLAMINLAYPLPGTVQRALSPFPGTWDERHVNAANLSTDWRTEMWKAALFTDEWIQNKIMGDGLGMTRLEMERIQDEQEGGRSTRRTSNLTAQQERMMITGGYHSGPVETVRVIGYVGLALLWTTMIRMLIHTHRLIRRSQGTEWQIPVLFFCIPIMVYPWFWTFIFGTFREAAVFIFMSSATIDLLNKNLPLPAWVPRSRQHIPLAVRNLPQPMHARA